MSDSKYNSDKGSKYFWFFVSNVSKIFIKISVPPLEVLNGSTIIDSRAKVNLFASSFAKNSTESNILLQLQFLQLIMIQSSFGTTELLSRLWSKSAHCTRVLLYVQCLFEIHRRGY